MIELKDKMYYSISELASYFDVAPSLLRYWESEFNNIKPKRNSKGTRFYTKKDIEEIAKIYVLVKDQGYTLQGAREQLKKRKGALGDENEALDSLQKIRQKLIEIKKKL